MNQFVKRLEKLLGVGRKPSKDDAKQRLKVLLVHDQVNLTPAQMELMKEELVAVVKKYCEVADEGVVIRLTKADDGISLDSTVPVRRVVAGSAA